MSSRQRFVIRALAGGLCVAALAAVLAVLTGGFGELETRVALTSLAFSLCSATAGAGDALRVRAVQRPTIAVVALATVAASAVAFVLVAAGVWLDVDGDALWRAFGVAGLLALWGAHASLVLRAQRRADPPSVGALVTTSLVTAGLDTFVATIAVVGVDIDPGEAVVRLLAASLIVMLLSTVLPPIVRKLADVPNARMLDPFRRPEEPDRVRLTLERLADEVVAVADRLDQLDAAPAVQREVAALRALAARAER